MPRASCSRTSCRPASRSACRTDGWPGRLRRCKWFRGGLSLGRHAGGEPAGPGTNHRDYIARGHPSVLHADLEAGRQDVREQDALGIGHAFGDLVYRVLGERDPNVFGLGPVDHVAEDPPDSGHALRVETVAVEALATVRAFPT